MSAGLCCCCSVVSNSLRPHGQQHARLPCPSPSTEACSNSCPSSWWCHPTISLSIVPFSSWLQSFPASGSFLMGQLFASGGQSIGASAPASVLQMNIQDWFPLGWTGWISLQSKRLSRVFSKTTVQKHQFFSTQPSLWSNSQMFLSPSFLYLFTEMTKMHKVLLEPHTWKCFALGIMKLKFYGRQAGKGSKGK